MPLRKVSADGVGIVALVCQQRIWRTLGQDDQGIVRLAVCRFASGEVKGGGRPRASARQ